MHTTEDKPTEQATTGRVYHMNFATGKLEPMRADHLLPVGSLVTYEDIKNPRRRYLVTGQDVGSYGYGQKIICEDGHASQVHAASVDKFGRTGGAWHFVRDPDTGSPVVLDPDAIAAFLVAADAEGARLKAEHEAATQAAAAAAITERAALLSEFAYLERADTSKKSSHALGAANLRRVLARAFPGVKFSVVSSSYSGGDSIRVSWDDGPTSAEVDKIADRFQTADFNGMEDISESRSNQLADLFGGAKYVQCSRHETDETIAKVAAELGYTVTNHRGAWGIEGEGIDDQIRQMIYREARARSYYTAPAAAPESTQAATEPAAATLAPSGVEVRENTDKDGVEIRFPAKPAASVLSELKAAGWRWSRFSSCWWHRRTSDALAFAHRLAGTAPAAADRACADARGREFAQAYSMPDANW